MSFLSIFKGIGKALLSPAAVTIESSLFPVAAVPLTVVSQWVNRPSATTGSLADTFQAAIVKAEAQNPGPGTGAIKLPQSASDIAAWLEAFNSMFLEGSGTKYMGDGELLTKAINSCVTSYNDIEAWRKSIKLQPTTATPTPPTAVPPVPPAGG